MVGSETDPVWVVVASELYPVGVVAGPGPVGVVAAPGPVEAVGAP